MKRLVDIIGVFLIVALVAGLVVLGILGSEPKVFSVDRVMKSVVHISAEAGWQGSGVYVGNGLILTAGHVVKDGGCFVISFENGQSSYSSTKSYLEPTADVGFILLEDYDGPVLEFDNDGYNRGDTAYIFGNPFGWDYNFSVSKGIVSALGRDCDGFFGEKLLLQVDSAAYPGNSGGPVTDDEGEIIGILVGGDIGSECISLCIPANICHQAMMTYLEVLKMAESK